MYPSLVGAAEKVGQEKNLPAKRKAPASGFLDILTIGYRSICPSCRALSYRLTPPWAT